MAETPTKAVLQEQMTLGYSLPLMKIQVSYLQKTMRDSRQRKALQFLLSVGKDHLGNVWIP